MKVEEIIKLIDAGYTKEDIQAMSAPDPAPKEPEPAPDPAPTEAPAAPDHMADMLQEIKDLKKAVYAMNLMSTDVPAQKSVDDILAEAMKGGK